MRDLTTHEESKINSLCLDKAAQKVGDNVYIYELLTEYGQVTDAAIELLKSLIESEAARVPNELKQLKLAIDDVNKHLFFEEAKKEYFSIWADS